MSLNLQNTILKISAGLPRQFPTEAIPEVAFSGRSNVGKSSLINCLLGRKSLARVSSAPGKTITVNFYEIDRKLFFVDLPGYGFAKRTYTEKQAWSALTDGFFTSNKNIDLLKVVVQLIDSRIGATKDDEMMLDFMNESRLPYIIVATKTDKLNATERRALTEKLRENAHIRDDIPIFPFSALKNEGKDEVWRAISTYTNVKI